MGYIRIGNGMKNLPRTEGDRLPSKMGSIRRPIPKVPPTAYEIEQAIIGTKLTTEEKAFACFSYLFATRVSEALSLSCDQIRIEEKGNKRLLKAYNIPCLKTVKTKTKAGIRTKEEIERIRPTRTVSIDMNKDLFFIEGFIDYYQQHSNRGRNKPLFGFKRVKAWAMIAKIGYWPHLFRHSRLSHLVRDYRFNSYELKAFTGWTDLASGENYVRQSGDYIDEIWIRQ